MEHNFKFKQSLNWGELNIQLLEVDNKENIT